MKASDPPACRGRGLAKRPVQDAFAASGAASLTVGCAPCGTAMYAALGCTDPLDNHTGRRRLARFSGVHASGEAA